MKSRKLNRSQLAEHLGCSRSYVSQILNGDTNLSLEKLYEISLAIGKVPLVQYEDLEVVLQRDAIQCESTYNLDSSRSASVHVISKTPTRPFSVVESFTLESVEA